MKFITKLTFYKRRQNLRQNVISKIF